MRYIIVYDEETKVVSSIDESAEHETINVGQNYVRWDTGSLQGLSAPVIIIDSKPEFDEGDVIDQSVIDLDISGTFDEKTYVEDLEQRLKGAEAALDFLMKI